MNTVARAGRCCLKSMGASSSMASVALLGERDFFWSGIKNVMERAFSLQSLGFSRVSSASGCKSCVWKNKGLIPRCI